MRATFTITEEIRQLLGIQALMARRTVAQQVSFLAEQEEKRLNMRLTALQASPTDETAA